MVQFTCKECGKVGHTYPSQPRQFCSLSCRSKFGARTGMPTKPRRGVELPCEHCGKPVYRSKGSRRRFCSRACVDAGARNGEDRQCEHCGAAFYAVPSSPDRFCGRECYEKQRIKRSGIGRQHNGREVIKDAAGYLRIWEPDHPAASQGRILEHRWLVEQDIGRVLRSDEHIHHVNGVKDDNRIENLELLGHSEHSTLTGIERQREREAMRAELAAYRERYGPLN